jgi:glycosyltransferase involved in cell wall biosynthesis
LSPPRWLWKEEILNPKSEILRSIEAFMKRKLKNWDYGGAQRVDEFVSISQEVAKRCKTYYDRESEVVYPPFDYEKWKNLVANSEWRIANGNEDIPLPYFLVVSRLEPYKRVEVAMEAFHKYKVLSTQYKEKAQKITLAIVGSGSQKSRLKALSSRLKIEDSIVWVEKVSDKELAWLYAHCKAFIMPQEEDYGYVACEAAACGAPIVAYANGGQIEPLSDYPNKILCDEQSAQCFAQALEKIGDIRYNAQTYENSHLRRGSRNTFVAAFSQKIAETV